MFLRYLFKNRKIWLDSIGNGIESAWRLDQVLIESCKWKLNIKEENIRLENSVESVLKFHGFWNFSLVETDSAKSGSIWVLNIDRYRWTLYGNGELYELDPLG